MNDTIKNVSYRYLVNGEYVNVDTIEEFYHSAAPPYALS